jgi:hypothetical protein
LKIKEKEIIRKDMKEDLKNRTDSKKKGKRKRGKQSTKGKKRHE